ncbi:PRD domain-containing protein [Corynebacterium pacaense]|uniref:PRD domain-containing protein n=1 Tax=Corynebacterium pacaense TaxID=1816684 RepID=UPI001FE244AF|nr:PRD domain-containing protein [Corynebacterium pacaense]
MLNNNVVLSRRDDGTAVVLTGLGIGFRAKPGDGVDEAAVSQVFVPENNRDSDAMAAMLAAIPQRFLELTTRVLEATHLRDDWASATVIALADHLSMAVRRVAMAGDTPNPLLVEVSHLYPDEYAASLRILEAVNAELDSPLPESEATAIAMHLVNAGFRTGDLSDTYLMTGVFSQLFEVIDSSFGIRVDQGSVTAARFITHMRYFFVRAAQGAQLREGMSVLLDSLEHSHPEAVDCARRTGVILELRLGTALTEDEVAYLSLHIARLVAEAAPGVDRSS